MHQSEKLGIKQQEVDNSSKRKIRDTLYSVFPTLDSGWERNFRIFRGMGAMENFEKQGRNVVGGIKFFWIRQGGNFIIVTQKLY